MTESSTHIPISGQAEALVGTIYAVAGLVLLRRFEVTARRHATLEVA